MALLCCGEILWDDFGDRRLLGGATFNVAAHAHRLGLPVHFVSAVGADPPGREALAQVAALGLESAMNLPVWWNGTALGAVNLLHGPGHFSEADAALGMVFASLAVPALLAG